MSKSRESVVMGEARKILTEFRKTMMFMVDPIKDSQLQIFLAHRLQVMYHEGFSDGLKRARDIFKGKEGE